MRIIALSAVALAVLLDVWGAATGSTVGGPMTLLLLAVAASGATGLSAAVVDQRGPPGFVLYVGAALIGGFVAIAAMGTVMEAIIPHLGLKGPLATSRHPMRYVASPAMMLAAVFGAWILLAIVKRVAGKRS